MFVSIFDRFLRSIADPTTYPTRISVRIKNWEWKSDRPRILSGRQTDGPDRSIYPASIGCGHITIACGLLTRHVVGRPAARPALFYCCWGASLSAINRCPRARHLASPTPRSIRSNSGSQASAGGRPSTKHQNTGLSRDSLNE